MLYISYGWVCELETQILLAGDLGFIEKGRAITNSGSQFVTGKISTQSIGIFKTFL